MNGNPFGDSIYSNLTGSNNQNNRQNTQNIHRNPFDEDDEVATVRFQPPPRPPKQANKSNSIGAGSQGVKSLRVFGGPTSPASPSVFSRATSIGGTPGASVFNSGGNRYSVVTTNSTSRSDKSTHNPFATDEDIENAEKSEIESHSRSPLYLSIDNRSTRSIGAQRSGYFPGSLIGNERYGDSEEVAACDDGGIELRITETGSSAGLTPPKKPIKQPKVSKNDEKTKEGARDSQTISGTLVASTPTSPSKKPKKIRKKIVAVDQLDENAVVRHLLSELVYGYPHTYGGRCSNFLYYVLYNHPLLSIYFTHRLHPFTRRHRCIVFLCSLSFAVCFALILLATPLVPVFATCRSVCNCQVVTDDDPRQPHDDAQSFSQCVGGYNDGRACSTYNDVCANYHSWMLSAVCGAGIVVYDSLLRFLATCSCVQGRKRFQNNCCGQRFKALVEYFGSVTLLICAVLSFFFVAFTVVFAYVKRIASEMFLVLVLSELWSTVQWIVWATPWFLYKFPGDKRKFYEKLKRRSVKHPDRVPPEAIV